MTHTYVVSGASGTGKTTLNRRLVSEHPNIEIAVSLTSRPKRSGEVDSVHYHFVSDEVFRRRLQKGDFLEWANVHGNLYGTSRTELKKIADRDHKAVLEIDVQGFLKAKPHLQRQSKSIFIFPPDLRTIWDRLEGRGTDDLLVRWRRFQNARSEIERSDAYEYFVVNDKLDVAYRDLEQVVVGDGQGSLSREKAMRLRQKLLNEYDSEPWIQQLSEQLSQ
jgi:guanylate kinase